MIWSDADKAAWILEHGEPEIVWIYELEVYKVYKRPHVQRGEPVPPWLNKDREIVYRKAGNKFTHVTSDEHLYTLYIGDTDDI